MRGSPRLLVILTLLTIIFALSVTVVAAQSGLYIVSPGDQLSRIAQRHGVTTSCLARVNGIRNPNRIYVGQVIHITACQTQPSVAPTAASVPVRSAPLSPSTYTIQPGDRLSTIAVNLGVDMSCLVRVNAIGNANRIQRGQVLQVDPCVGQGGGGIAPRPLTQNYVVQRGDKMSNIASTFGVDLLCLARANKIANMDLIFVGETLVIDSSCAAQANS